MRLLLFIFLSLFSLTCSAKAAGELEERMCRTNLLLIHDALEHYRSATDGQWPLWLDDIYPNFLNDEEVLYCPESNLRGTTSVGVTGKRNLKDTKTSYYYEFHPVPLSSLPGRSNRDWKMAQLKIVGTNMPVVRCLAHGSVYLNLAVDGHVYESGLKWEDNFPEIASGGALDADRLLRENSHVRVITVPQRARDATRQELDLSSAFNLSLFRAEIAGSDTVDLSSFHGGLVKWQDTAFDVRGAIQLASKSPNTFGLLPAQSLLIAVGQKCRRIHFLHGCVGKADGATVAKYSVARDVAGQRFDINLFFGRDIGDVRGKGTDTVTGATACSVTNNSGTITLYHFVWDNPAPEKPITNLRFISTMSSASPVLVAISVEP